MTITVVTGELGAGRVLVQQLREGAGQAGGGWQQMRGDDALIVDYARFCRVVWGDGDYTEIIRMMHTLTPEVVYTWFDERGRVMTKDISSLDAFSDDDAVADMGYTTWVLSRIEAFLMGRTDEGQG